MSARATVTQAEYRRAIKAAQECGLTVRGCEITPDRVRLVFQEDPPPNDIDLPPTIGDDPAPKAWPRG